MAAAYNGKGGGHAQKRVDWFRGACWWSAKSVGCGSDSPHACLFRPALDLDARLGVEMRSYSLNFARKTSGSPTGVCEMPPKSPVPSSRPVKRMSPFES